MKNKYYERMRHKAKQDHRNNCFNHRPVDTVYEFETPIDNFVVLYKQNDYLIQIEWIHPKRKYVQIAEDTAWRAYGEKWVFDLKWENIYKKQGRSRKKVYLSRMWQGNGNAGVEADIKKAYLWNLTNQSDVVRPSMWTGRTPYGLDVELVAPIAPQNMYEIVDFVKQLRSGRTTIAEAFGDYQYGKEDMLADTEFFNALRGKDV